MLAGICSQACDCGHTGTGTHQLALRDTPTQCFEALCCTKSSLAAREALHLQSLCVHTQPGVSNHLKSKQPSSSRSISGQFGSGVDCLSRCTSYALRRRVAAGARGRCCFQPLLPTSEFCGAGCQYAVWRACRATQRCTAGVMETMHHFSKVPGDEGLPPQAAALKALVSLYHSVMDWQNGTVPQEAGAAATAAWPAPQLS